MRFASVVLSIMLLLAGPVLAQENDASASDDSSGGLLPYPSGLRVGHTSWDGLSQFHLGVHTKLGELAPNLHLNPNLEFGFGDHMTIVALNGDLVYNFTELAEHPWGFFAGGSLSLHYLSPEFGDSDSQLGLTGVAGVTRTTDRGDELALELRLGLMDSPDLKLTFGYTFF